MNITASNGVMNVGHQLDNLATVISFPIGDIVTDQGAGGSWSVRIQRSGDVAAYPTSNFSVSNNNLNLILTSSDLAVVGEGQIQLKYTVGSKVLMSRVYKFYSHYSLDASATTPEPWVSWVDEVEANADRAEEAVEHYPYIDSTTHHWMQWDVEEEEFVDTGVSAQGTSDFEELSNRPKYNGSYMDGDTDIPLVPTVTNDYTDAEKQKVADAYADRHTHSNKSVLDAITSALTSAWTTASTWVTANGATVVEHLSNAVVHITAAERTAWNAKADQSTTYTKTEVDNTFVRQTENLLTTTTKNVVGAINEVNSGKVDKVTGKGLSTNDYDATEKQKVTDAYADKHTHTNKSVLDGIDSSDVSSWDAKAEVVKQTSISLTVAGWAHPVTVSTDVSGGTVTVNEATFLIQISTSGSYEFTYDGTDWTYDSSTVTLATYGITLTGTPSTDDTITAVVSSNYKQGITISGADANTKVDLEPSYSVLNQLIADGVNGMYVENNNGTLTCYAMGAKPSVALTIQATYYEVTA